MSLLQTIKGWFGFGATVVPSTDDEVRYELTMIPLLELGTGVYDTYLNTVKKKNYYTFEYVQKKLTRNVMLALPLPQRKMDRTLYLYGNLEILVVENTIVWIRNNKKFDNRRKGWKKNYVEHKRLGEMLGI